MQAKVKTSSKYQKALIFIEMEIESFQSAEALPEDAHQEVNVFDG